MLAPAEAHAARYRKIDVRPLTGALGAEILGPDLSKPLDDATFAEIHRAFLDHLVIFFRDQSLKPNHILDFAKRFGPIDPHPYLRGMEGFPEVLEIVREKTDKHIFAPGSTPT
jgi:taurine dioxygenase